MGGDQLWERVERLRWQRLRWQRLRWRRLRWQCLCMHVVRHVQVL
jgi:hypothetical protein